MQEVDAHTLGDPQKAGCWQSVGLAALQHILPAARPHPEKAPLHQQVTTMEGVASKASVHEVPSLPECPPLGKHCKLMKSRPSRHQTSRRRAHDARHLQGALSRNSPMILTGLSKKELQRFHIYDVFEILSYKCICVHVCIYIFIYLCVCICVHMYAHIYMYIKKSPSQHKCFIIITIIIVIVIIHFYPSGGPF